MLSSAPSLSSTPRRVSPLALSMYLIALSRCSRPPTKQSPTRPRARNSSLWSRSPSENSSPPGVSSTLFEPLRRVRLPKLRRRLTHAQTAPEFYVASAISFYKALKVYPAPQELLMIYQKTQPAAVFDLVMELISLEINEATAAATASTTTSGPRAGAGSLPSDPLLEEVEPEKSRTTTASVSESGSGAENSSPSSGGSFVHVETDAVLTPKGEVEIEETIAVVADLEAEVEGQGAASVPPAATAVAAADEEDEAETPVESVASATEDKADPPEPVLA